MEAYKRIMENVDSELSRQVYQKLEDVQCLIEELSEVETKEKVHQLNMDILDDLHTVERLYTLMIASADCGDNGAIREYRRLKKVADYKRDMCLELDTLIERISRLENEHNNERYLICKCSG